MFDLHTHHLKKDAIVNLAPCDVLDVDFAKTDFFYSVGVHPMFLENAEEQLKIVSDIASDERIKFIGEIGLDKRNENLDLQRQIFEQQLQIATDAKKPVIIHCVRAVNEVLDIARHFDGLPLVFHGFRGKPQLAEQILNAGAYISLGEKSLLVPETVRVIPDNRLFVETDESEMPIELIVEKVANLRKTDVKSLENVIKKNILSCVLEQNLYIFTEKQQIT